MNRAQPRIKIKPPFVERTRLSRFERKDNLERLGNELGISKLDDWYNVSQRELVEKGGEKLIIPYGRSMYKLLQDIHPTHTWDPWKFSGLPRNSLIDPLIRRKYIQYVASQLGIQKLDDWYKISSADLKKVGLLKQFYTHFRSLHEALQETYPEHRWVPWFFSTAPKGFFMKPENQKMFFDWLGTQLGIKNMDDWYSITAEKVESHGGGRVLCIHGYSLYSALSKLYPEHDWKNWRFHMTPRNTWTNERASQFVHEISEKLGIKQLDDWYRVSRPQLVELSAISILQHYGSLYHLLKAVYPHHPWQPQMFRSKAKKSTQRWLKVLLTKLFPNEEIFEDFQHPDISLGSSPLELDVFIPKLNLAFEYQGEQHYRNLFFFAPQARYQQRDNYKNEKCKENNVTLIEVPYWWDRKEASLAATIQQARPDVQLNIQGKIALSPIPDQPPILLKKSPKEVVESQPAPKKFPLMLATDWKEDAEISGWYCIGGPYLQIRLMSRKYDGIRAYWSSKDKTLYSRQGKPIKVPSLWIQSFPETCDLDGELTCEEGYNDLVEIMKSKNEDSWARVKFQAFDSVTSNSTKEPYQARYNRLLQLKEERKLPDNVQVVEHAVCKGKEDMNTFFDAVKAKGGEGVILRDPNSVYLPEISSKFLKVKPFADAEVKFLQVKEQKGFAGLICQQSNGQLCFVHCDGEVTSNPPPTGTLITVKYSGIWKSGKLKNPYFYRIAADKSIQEPTNFHFVGFHKMDFSEMVSLFHRRLMQEPHSLLAQCTKAILLSNGLLDPFDAVEALKSDDEVETRCQQLIRTIMKYQRQTNTFSHEEVSPLFMEIMEPFLCQRACQWLRLMPTFSNPRIIDAAKIKHTSCFPSNQTLTHIVLESEDEIQFIVERAVIEQMVTINANLYKYLCLDGHIC